MQACDRLDDVYKPKNSSNPLGDLISSVREIEMAARYGIYQGTLQLLKQIFFTRLKLLKF